MTMQSERKQFRAPANIDDQGCCVRWRTETAAPPAHYRAMLDLNAQVPCASHAELERVANIAKHECPVSKLLNAPITLSVQLEPNEVIP